ncbi:Thioredoxin [Musa troglodytarum]|uniref:protein disulfide-isomerase n=1 Tax=Musa troglodytarum TaxID=320322 RepID=A0A9E7JGY8_9LILI|nr:Thioredoxin [Musa troglodytarum]
MTSRVLLGLAISSLLLAHAVVASAPLGGAGLDLDEEDLSFLEEEEEGVAVSHEDKDSGDNADGSSSDSDESEYDDQDQYEAFDDLGHGSHNAAPTIDETDVVVLTDGNFSDFLEKHRHVMVEFYAPWCGHCQALAPEYAAAATALRGEDAVLAKVDATEENELAQRFEVQGFPTVLFFVDGVHRDYPGQRTRQVIRDRVCPFLRSEPSSPRSGLISVDSFANFPYPVVHLPIAVFFSLFFSPLKNLQDAIVTWIKKKIGPGVENITTVDEAEKILTSESKVVLGFLDSLVMKKKREKRKGQWRNRGGKRRKEGEEAWRRWKKKEEEMMEEEKKERRRGGREGVGAYGDESQDLSAASKLEDGVNFYQTVNPDVAKLFHIDPSAKRPSVVLLKEEAEKISYFDGQFSKSAIVDFVFANKLPLVTTFTRESAPEIFENPIKKQLLLFAASNDTTKVMPAFQEAAKLFKGKLIFVYVEMDNDDVGKPVSDYFGVTGDDPQVLAYTGNEDAKKFILEGEVTLDDVKKFAEGFLEDTLKPFYKSDPLPETNDGDVKIIVGKNFDEIVLDESKDVLLEIYAPWCGHCQALEPTYNKLARHLRGIESLVMAKMDGTTNEHPRAKADGFPTLLFFPAGNKSFEPITVDTDRTVKAFYNFIKKHASIPVKLQRPASVLKTEASSDGSASTGEKSGGADVKDEL